MDGVPGEKVRILRLARPEIGKFARESQTRPPLLPLASGALSPDVMLHFTSR